MDQSRPEDVYTAFSIHRQRQAIVTGLARLFVQDGLFAGGLLPVFLQQQFFDSIAVQHLVQ
jgi:hypothetical protein